MKEKQKRIFVISYIVVIFSLLFYTVCNRYLSNLDEVWNFNIAKEIANGKVVYRDISLVTTPLFYFINAIPLKLIANELIIYRMSEVFMITIMVYLTFKIFQKIHDNNNIIALMLSSLVFLVLYNNIANNYNFLSVIWLLVIVNLELSSIDKNKIWYNLLIGLIAGLAILTKQTVGICIAAISIIKILLEITDKKEVKQQFINIGFRIIGIIVPIIVFIIYCLITHSFYDFIDYTVLGISTFSNKITIIEFFKKSEYNYRILEILLMGLSIVGFVYILFNRIKNKKPCRVTMIMIYGLSLVVLSYPIADKEHFILGFYIFLIVALIEVVRLFEKTKKLVDNKRFDFLIYFLVAFVTLFAMFSIIKLLITNYNNSRTIKEDYCTEYEYYRYIPISSGIKERIDCYTQLYNEYKNENKELVILDSEAAVYLIPTNSYRKDYDMFNKGNFGSKGEDGIINNIKESNNTVYLVKPENAQLNWQTPKKVIEYIRKNITLKESKLIYNIYEK